MSCYTKGNYLYQLLDSSVTPIKPVKGEMRVYESNTWLGKMG